MPVGVDQEPRRDPAARLRWVKARIDRLKDREEELEGEVQEEEDKKRDEEHEAEVEQAREEGYEEQDHERLVQLARYGGHTDCYFGVIVGQKLHPLCTCGWNEVRTEVEMAGLR